MDYLTEKISSPDSIEFLLPPQNDAFHYSKIPRYSMPPAATTTSATAMAITHLQILMMHSRAPLPIFRTLTTDR
ncbi:unnamed protein product [Malus baccata var. baccata]